MSVAAMRPWGSEFFDHVRRHVDAFYGLPPHIHQAVVEAYIGGAIVNELNADDMKQLVAPWLADSGRNSFYRQFAQADERFTAEVEPLYGGHSVSGGHRLGRGRPLDPAGPGSSTP